MELDEENKMSLGGDNHCGFRATKIGERQEISFTHECLVCGGEYAYKSSFLGTGAGNPGRLAIIADPGNHHLEYLDGILAGTINPGRCLDAARPGIVEADKHY